MLFSLLGHPSSSCENLVENVCFACLDAQSWWKSGGQCSLWKRGFAVLVEVSWKTFVWKYGFSFCSGVSWKMFVLKVWIVIFCEGVVVNVRLGSVGYHFLRRSCG